jgi:energy-coupling factor transport system ATP-binding protein
VKNVTKIKIKNLHFSYDQKNEAIKDVSLTINKGSWVAVVGPNGSGKSTLAKLLVGLLKADSGTIHVDEIFLNDENLTKIRKKIGIVFQNPDNQFVGVTVKHDIAFGLENQLVPQPEIVELVDKYAEVVGMKENLDKEPYQLSGGQKQRVAIAGALAMNQEIMIFDEATSMLDPEGTREITNFIVKLNEEYHKTLITITHDLELARRADRVIVMNEGGIVMEGTPDEIFAHSEMLKNIDLDIPFGLKIYEKILQDETLKNDKELVEALWAYSLKK